MVTEMLFIMLCSQSSTCQYVIIGLDIYYFTARFILFELK